MKTIIGRQAEFVHNLSYAALPEHVIEQAKECILDTVGCAIAGAGFAEISGAITTFKEFDRQRQCSIWGTDQSCSLQNAILINAMSSHAVEMDDVHKTSKTHTGAVVIPAAVTLAGYRHTNGRELISAVVAGYETALRIGTGINAAAHRLQGWHATGVCCTFGAAAALAKLMQLSEVQTMQAMGMAGVQSSGLWALTMDGATCKKLHMGHAAQSGLPSTLLAKGGMTGPGYIIEAADGGLFKAASSGYDFAAVTAGLGTVWEILKVDRKPYACCRSAQPPIDAILSIKKEFDISADSVEHILVETYEIAVKQCFNTKRPANIVEAQLCIPYTVAVALLDGAASAKQFTAARLDDERLMALADKVDVCAAAEFTVNYPLNWGCKLTLSTKDGRKYQKTIINAKGDSANPLSGADLESKFKSLTKGIVTYKKQQEIIDFIYSLEKQEDISGLVDLLSI